MKMLIAASAAFLLLSGCAALPTETRNEEIAYQTLAAVDATTTLRIADNPNRFHEMNPVLGEHPQPGKVAEYFALSGAAHYGITELLVTNDAPPWVVRGWELGGIGLELGCVGNNLSHGINPTLSFHVNLDKPGSGQYILPRDK